MAAERQTWLNYSNALFIVCLNVQSMPSNAIVARKDIASDVRSDFTSALASLSLSFSISLHQI